jgi:hypothetical protein
MAPVGGRDLLEILRCHEVGEASRAAPVHRVAGPAMKPSSDIALFTTTFPMPIALILFLQKFDPVTSSGASSAATWSPSLEIT